MGVSLYILKVENNGVAPFGRCRVIVPFGVGHLL